ncbi:carbon storage regulator CsrA [Alteromonas mediterranea]|jgi:carbon storage regulator|uniref:carbon storage regulator CsrA n=1 Tax=Alteromonas mediterranea TaxID=314275 RepID=UPI0003554E06|nr:carbon storage regulator CsrA [Alteromonas mediterranea]AGP86554.1 carbon storage regulator CsrA [Alteromonas mediterranea U4]AGP90716.1 carbon storage regulator CsrA [Alteromonas mediterranea U7]AGP94547.1 carbon storage regulator CsrA [Alteromonas mediterranea U8]
MLVLSLNLGRSLYIGDNTKMTILNVEGTQIKIGIDAPKDVSVYREEIYNRIRAQKKTT